MSSTDTLASYSNLLIKQTKKGCLQELMGCEAQSEFNIATKEAPKDHKFYALEDTSCLMRFCLKGNRPWVINMTDGAQKGGAGIAKFDRPLACPMGNCKCCCFQSVSASNAAGEKIGESREDMWFCVPSFSIYDKNDTKTHVLHMPTCCGGMCVNVCADGICTKCRIPFNVYKADNDVEGQSVGSITKVWGGLGKEIFTDADTFEAIFPTDATPECKASLVGATFMINQLFFEGNGAAQQ